MKASKAWIIKPTVSGVKREVQFLLKIGILAKDRVPIKVPAVIDQETWDLAREQLQRNKERAPRNDKKFDYLLKGLLICGCCQLRMHGHAGIPATRIRR